MIAGHHPCFALPQARPTMVLRNHVPLCGYARIATSLSGQLLSARRISIVAQGNDSGLCLLCSSDQQG